MKKESLKLPLLITIVVAVLGLSTWVAVGTLQPKAQPQVSSQTQTVSQKRTEITYTAKAGKTSLEQLKNEASDVVIKESSYGPYVDSIEGYKGGVDGKYWSFYVDGKLSEVGADSYTQKGGEKIEWKFQKL